MKPTRVHWMVLGVVVLLAANLWHWWPRSKTPAARAPEAASRPASIRVEDFRLRAVVDGSQGGPSRDLFQPKFRPPPVVVKPKEPPPPPPKTPEQLAEEAARAELGHIRLLAVAIRAGRGEAYLSVQGQAQHARVGDKVGARFVVEAITAEGVRIRDPATGVEGNLAVTGN
ncbi:MAG: hypothetical protein AAB329_07275 [Pseudomonadota bacterium]